MDSAIFRSSFGQQAAVTPADKGRKYLPENTGGDKMTDNRMENNRVDMTGKIISGFRYSHQIYEEAFYLADICISGTADTGM